MSNLHKPPRKKRGRPSKYNKQLAREICAAISCTTASLKTLCKHHDDWPGYATIMEWLLDNADFSDQYARARMAQATMLVDGLLEDVDNSTNHLQTRLKIDTIKWIACKHYPKIYGDRSEVAVNMSHDAFVQWADGQKE